MAFRVTGNARATKTTACFSFSGLCGIFMLKWSLYSPAKPCTSSHSATSIAWGLAPMANESETTTSKKSAVTTPPPRQVMTDMRECNKCTYTTRERARKKKEFKKKRCVPVNFRNTLFDCSLAYMRIVIIKRSRGKIEDTHTYA